MREDVRRALDHIRAIAPGPADDTIEKVIAKYRSGMDAYGDIAPRPPLPGVTVTAFEADGVRGEWIVPDGAIEDERIVHCHGGGLVAGSLASHRAMLSALARAARRPVLSVDYRLAPEHVYPAAHDDCRAAFAWAAGHGPGGPSPARRLALGGDSMGGVLAMSVCADALDGRQRAPDCLVLIGAVLTHAALAARPDRDTDPVVSNAGLGLTALYTGEMSLADPRLSPLNLDDAVLARFPPVLLQASSIEFLLYDSETLAKRLESLNRHATLSVWPDMPHVWHHFTTHLPEAEAALTQVARFIDDALRA